MCQFFVACNSIPSFGDKIDNAIKNRIMAIEFKTTFVDHPKFKH